MKAITITSVNGQTVQKHWTGLSAYEELNLENSIPGVYLVTIELNSGEFIRKRITKL